MSISRRRASLVTILCLIVLSLLTAGTARAEPPPRPGPLPAPRSGPRGATGISIQPPDQRVAVPAYFAPGADWTRLQSAGSQQAVAVMNPNNGPGATKDDAYASTVASAHAAGVAVLGYVYTRYDCAFPDVYPCPGGTDALTARLKGEIDNFFSWYGVDGILFDEATNDCPANPDPTSHVAFYTGLTAYVKGKSAAAISVLNPGTSTGECYMSATDVVLTFEGTYASYLQPLIAPGWTANYPPARFWHLIYAAPDAAAMQQAIVLSKGRRAGWVYVTSGTLPNPWGALPPSAFWTAEVSAAQATPAVRDTFTTIDSGSWHVTDVGAGGERFRCPGIAIGGCQPRNVTASTACSPSGMPDLCLGIPAPPQSSGGQIVSRAAYQYGTFDTAFSAAASKHAINSVFLYDFTTQDEIDIEVTFDGSDHDPGGVAGSACGAKPATGQWEIWFTVWRAGVCQDHKETRLPNAQNPQDPQLPTALHDYRIDWQPAGTSFAVDGVPAFTTTFSPRSAGMRLVYNAWLPCWEDALRWAQRTSGACQNPNAPSSQDTFSSTMAVNWLIANAVSNSANVRDYGAGDGVTGDGVAFSRALSDLTGFGGGTLIVPPGVYTMPPSTGLTVPDHVNVEATEATIKASDYGYALLNISGANVGITGLTVDGDTRVVRGIEVGAGVSDLTIQASTVQNVKQPADPAVAGYQQNALQVTAGIRIEGNGNRITIDSTTVQNVTSVNVPAGGNRVVAARGIWIAPPSGQSISTNITIQNSTISEVGPKDDGDCVVIQDSSQAANLIINNNTFTRCHKRAVKVQVPGVTVTNNQITNPFHGDNTSPTDDLPQDMYAAISAYTHDVTVTGNMITGTGTFYIGIEAGADPCVTLSKIAISQNTVSMGTPVASDTNAIRAMAPMDQFTVTNNTLSHAMNGVVRFPGSTNETISGNTTTDVTTPAQTYGIPCGALTPTVTGVSPASGPASGGTTVTVSGTNFSTTGGSTTIKFGGTAASGVSCSSDTRCVATSPAGTGTVDVTAMVAGVASAIGAADQFTYTAVCQNGTRADITTPTGGSITTSTQTFTWAGGACVSQYYLYVGSTPGQNDLYGTGPLAGTVTSATVAPGIPVDGRTIYVRLWSLVNGSFQAVDHSYIMGACNNPNKADIASPSGGSITSGTPTFQWAGGACVTQYYLYAGSQFGQADLFSAGPLAATVASATAAPAIPVDGRTIYVRLWSLVNGGWQSVDRSYIMGACNNPGRADITSPSGGSVTSGTPVFQWSGGSCVTQYYLYVGSSFGSADLYSSGPLSASTTSATISPAIPVDGRTIYVRLWSLVNGGFQAVDHSYLMGACQNPAKADISSPAGSTLQGASQSFQWSGGGCVTQYYLYVGSAYGAADLYSSGPLAGTVTSQTVVTLPANGSTVYLRLWSLVNGTWLSVDHSYVSAP